MKVLSALSAILLAAAAVTRGEDALTIARDGKSDYVIVLPAQARPVEKTAAGELREYLAQVSGAKLPILPDTKTPANVPRIVLGAGKLTRELLPDFDPAALAPDAIVIKTVGRDLVLAGHPRRGTLYAVFTFLEDTVGVRWWSSSETHLPKLPTLTVPRLDVAYAPKLTDRATRYRELSDGCFRSHEGIDEPERRRMGVFAARLKLNGHDHWPIPAEYGGPDELVGWVHTFFQIEGLLPPAKYFKDHPQWYSLIDGKRHYRRGQLCLTNKEMLAEMIRVVSERLRKHPGATMISVSQNDWHGNCQCEKCRAVDEKEGYAGRVADPLRQRRGGWHRAGVSRHQGGNARLPVHSQAAQVRPAAAQRGGAAVHHRVLLLAAAGRGPAERAVPPGYRGLEPRRPAAFDLELREELGRLPGPAPQLSRAGPQPAILRQAQRHRRLPSRATPFAGWATSSAFAPGFWLTSSGTPMPTRRNSPTNSCAVTTARRAPIWLSIST